MQIKDDANSDVMEQRVAAGWSRLSNIVIRAARHEDIPETGALVNPPVSRGSTVVFPTIDAMSAQGRAAYDHELVYGAMGNPNQHALERLIAEIEGGSDTQIVGSGLNACALALLAYVKAGDHVLMADSVYGPTRRLAKTFLRRSGVEVSFYPPMADAETLKRAMRASTCLVLAESPGSHSFEVQDIPMIAEVARAEGARLVVDNTWGFGIFNPFEHGAHVSIQALTKYAAGHSDVLLGSVTVATGDDWTPLRDTAIQLGLCASPDDCWLTLRGLRSMPVRLEKQARNAYRVARWLAAHPKIDRVLHPALPDSIGHAFWKRDFTGAGCVFGVRLDARIPHEAARALIDGLRVFSIGASWGGFESLVLPTTQMIHREHIPASETGFGFRLQIGLEDVTSLIDDLDAGLEKLDLP